MERIGILGGTFDPVHTGHMIMARAAMEQYDLDRVLIMTGGVPPHKSGADITDARLRHKMVELAVQGEDGLIPFDFELNKPDATYTAKTLVELREINGNTEYYFIIGADSLETIVNWYRPDIIVKNCVLLVYPRGDIDTDALIRQRKAELGADIRAVNAPVWSISSTEIRRRVREGKSIRYFVPDKVCEFIREHGIYG